MAALIAGLPESVPGCTVNRLCASGLEAINVAARMIESGMADVIVAGGVESMTRAPLVMLKPETAFPRGNREMADTTLGWRFTNPKLAERYFPFSMGETAENVARRYGISREDQDQFALIEPAANEARHGPGPIRRRDRSRGGAAKERHAHPLQGGRAPAAGNDARGVGEAAARFRQGRHGDRRKFLRHQRRRRSRALGGGSDCAGGLG